MTPSGFQPILEFDSASSEFSRGFEAGRIWAVLQASPDRPVDVFAHAANAEMFMRMADATGRTVNASDLEGEWINVLFSAVDGCVEGAEVL
jgi:hypothetical protein